METHPRPSESDGQGEGGPADGPAREPGSDSDAGASSQDQPEPASGDASPTGERAAVSGHDPEGPADSNEKADDRATIVDPPSD